MMKRIIGIKIYPRVIDNWTNLPPILGVGDCTTGIIFTHGSDYPSGFNPDGLCVITNYLHDIGIIDNEFVFLEKTRSSSRDDLTKTKGIGGLARLKSFNFSIKRYNLNSNYPINFIGCRVEVAVVDDATHEIIKFVGSINRPSSDLKTIRFTIEGIISTNESSIEVDDGEVVVIGDDRFIKLPKKTNSEGKTYLYYDKDRYTIKGLYVKDKSKDNIQDPNSYYPITSNWEANSEGEIFFNNYGTTNTVKSFESLTNSYKIGIADPAIVGFVFTEDHYNLSPPSVLEWSSSPNTPSNPSVNIKYSYLRSDVYLGRSMSYYTTDPDGSFLLGTVLTCGHLNISNNQGDPFVSVSIDNGINIKDSNTPNLLNRCHHAMSNETYAFGLVGTGVPTSFHKPFNNGDPNLLSAVEIKFKHNDNTYTAFGAVKITNHSGNDHDVELLVSKTLYPDLVIAPDDIIEILTTEGESDYINFFISAKSKAVCQTSNDVDNFVLDNTNDYISASFSWQKYVYSYTEQFQYEPTDHFAGFTMDVPDLNGNIVYAGLYADEYGTRQNLTNLSDRAMSANIYSYINIFNESDDLASPVYNSDMRGVYPFICSAVINDGTESKQGKTFKNTSFKTNDHSLAKIAGYPATLKDWKNTVLSLSTKLRPSIYPYGGMCKFNGNFYVSGLRLNLEAELSIKDNDFYAYVSENIDWIDTSQLTLVTSVNTDLDFNDNLNLYIEKDSTILHLTGNTGSSTKGSTFSIIDLFPTSAYDLNYINGDADIVRNISNDNLCYFINGNDKYFDTVDNINKSFLGDFRPFVLNSDNKKFVVGNFVYELTDTGSGSTKLSKYSMQMHPLFQKSNPVSIIYRLFTKYMGLSNDLIDLTDFNAIAFNRSDWKASLSITKRTSISSLINDISTEHGLVVFEQANGKISIVDLDPPNEDDVFYEIPKNVIKQDFPKESYTSIDYLITSIKVNYNSGKSEIPSSSLDQRYFDKAKEFLYQTDMNVELVLDTVFEESTALKSAEIKQTFHYVPTRILSFSIRPFFVELGQWIKIDPTTGWGTDGKIYLIKKVGDVLKDSLTPLVVYEFDIDNLNRQIQEVPYKPDDIIGEVTSSTEILQEVSDATD